MAWFAWRVLCERVILIVFRPTEACILARRYGEDSLRLFEATGDNLEHIAMDLWGNHESCGLRGKSWGGFGYHGRWCSGVVCVVGRSYRHDLPFHVTQSSRKLPDVQYKRCHYAVLRKFRYTRAATYTVDPTPVAGFYA